MKFLKVCCSSLLFSFSSHRTINGSPKEARKALERKTAKNAKLLEITPFHVMGPRGDLNLPKMFSNSFLICISLIKKVKCHRIAQDLYSSLKRLFLQAKTNSKNEIPTTSRSIRRLSDNPARANLVFILIHRLHRTKTRVRAHKAQLLPKN